MALTRARVLSPRLLLLTDSDVESRVDDGLPETLIEWILADGATGTNLFNMGLQSGDAPELWNVTEQDKIRALYRGSVDAGSDLFLTNTFGGNAARLKLHDAQARVHELNRVGAELGREVADAAGRPSARVVLLRGVDERGGVEVTVMVVNEIADSGHRCYSILLMSCGARARVARRRKPVI